MQAFLSPSLAVAGPTPEPAFGLQFDGSRYTVLPYGGGLSLTVLLLKMP
jgi:hypothetical protein